MAKSNISHFNKLMVANRGEIAIRIFRAASELNIPTVAVYTFEDRYSLHRYKADEAYQIGDETEPLKPYLDIEEIIQLAKSENIDAIHPGYGFLSENVEFARRCKEEGIVFVGPEPEVMEKLGDKIAAKKIADKVDVPLIEDSKVSLDKPEIIIKEAKRIGYPVILKAAAGGGGRGMRVVREEKDLIQAVGEAKNEAKRAFGIDTIFIEKFIDNPKHIEVQILGDNHGNIIHLLERDCSVQRRFQKVVEIAPCPTLPQEVKQKIYDYALKIARHVKYNNAGTVEFLVDPQHNIFFIEVNPRIQVEHTITEEITGIDIVRSQILIAQGHKLHDPPIFIKDQLDIKANGFAIQCRITTEDPTSNFRPDYGTIIAYRNAGGFGIRLDEGSSYPGVKISPFFDSMLVKVSSWGRTLWGAAERLDRTLREFRIRGVKHNIPFLLNVVRHEVFKKGEATVKFIENHPELFTFERRLDRGTKTLRYLAEVTVNGNPDVKYIDPAKKFRTPRVPNFDRYSHFPEGTKNKLTELGRKGFVDWVKKTPHILYTDTTFRDAHQSLMATRVRTVDMLAVAESFAKNHPQTFSMEVWGGATFDVALRFLHECPWKRLQLFREAMPNLLLQMLIRSSNAVGYTAYPDNLVEKFIEKSWENGVDVFRIFDSLNWIEPLKKSIKVVNEKTGGLAEGCICYTGDISNPKKDKYTLKYYVDLAKQLEDAGAHILGIKDMAGLLKPYAAEQLIPALKEVIDIPIHLHTHDTSSIQSATYLKAIEAGVDIVDVALSSMSGLTSQPNFNSVVSMMESNKRHQSFDMGSLNAFSAYWEDVREYYYPFETELKAGTADVFEHEIPGGQYSNLRPQARSLGLEDKFEEIKKNYAVVNRLFGDVIKVTPSSKVVGDLALFMTSNNFSAQDLMEKGDEISFPDSVKSLFRGDLGQAYQGFPKKLQKLVLKDEQPYTDHPNEHLEPVDFEKEFAEFQEKFDDHCDFLDFLSYQMYPKVFADYYKHYREFGDVWQVPTPAFFFGMQTNEEIIITIDEGKHIIVKLLNVSDADEEGNRMIFFELNGQTRNIVVTDNNLKIARKVNRKVEHPGDVGAPLQGRIENVLVKKGDKVKKNQPLFVIEAMKMENTVSATKTGKVKSIVLNTGDMVNQDDVVVEIE